jgi:hypothetical protein
MSEYLQTKFRGERVAIHGKRSGMVFFLNLHDLDSKSSLSTRSESYFMWNGS